MAGQEEVGSIVYQVEMEIDPLLQGGRSANRAIGQLDSTASTAGKTFKTLDTQLSSTARSVSAASGSAKRLGGSFQQIGYQIQDFVVQVQGGQSAMVAFGQQGSQLAGAFGPGGAILGAVIALASALAGPLLASLGSSSNKMADLQKAAESLNKIVVLNSQGVAALSNDYARLAATNAALATQLRDAAVARYAAEVENARKAVSNIAEEQTSWWRSLSGGVASVTAAGNALDTLSVTTDNFKEAINQAEGAGTAFRSSTQTLLSTVAMMADKFDISEQSAFTLVKQLNELAKNPTSDNVTKISQSIAGMKSATDEGRLALVNFRDELTKAGASAAQAEQAVKDLEASIGRMKTEAQAANFDSLTKGLNQQLIGLKQGKQAAIEYAIAQQDLTKDQKDEVIALSRQVAAAEEAAEANKKAEGQSRRLAGTSESVAQKLANLRRQSELTASSTDGLSREQAILRAELSLGESATQEQIRLAGEYAGKIWDTTNAIRAQQQAEQGKKFAKQEIASTQSTIDPATGQAIDPMAQVNLQEQQKLDALAKYQELDKQNTVLYEQAKTAIQADAAMQRRQISDEENERQRQNMSNLLGATSDFFGQMAGAVGDYAGESSAAYKALFAVSKGFAVAQASMNLITAISNAAALPWPANIPAIAFAAAQGASLISQIRGANYGGGREHGGPVSADNMYRVGEKGKPELYRASNGSQYMIPGDNGKVISNKDMMSGSGNSGVVINIQNYTSGTVDAQTSSAGGQLTVDIVVADFDNGGPMSQAVSRNHQAPRKATG